MTLPVHARSRSTAPRGRLAPRDPFRELDELYDRLTSLWESSFGGAVDRWVPSADLEETDDAWSLELELPGVARDDVDVQLQDRVLTVAGEVQEKERSGILHRRARRVGAFQYSVTLPGEVDADGVEASLHDGVLTVRVPKSPAAKPRRIAISS
ncbi:Hsp20/alpha crystallin family protein [Modestobacter marinus]|uniref:Hsp20/alpha crystallin family protein n=1 Tax=Modestobacter marinus TaxID=477641 RepID=UPI001C9771E2|nr:Hsp20/alpha crystallin family protein [Modestobacter marinus]